MPKDKVYCVLLVSSLLLHQEQAVEAQERYQTALDQRAVRAGQSHLAPRAQGSLLHPADGETSQVVGRVEVGDERLEEGIGITRRWWDGVDHRVERATHRAVRADRAAHLDVAQLAPRADIDALADLAVVVPRLRPDQRPARRALCRWADGAAPRPSSRCCGR